MKFSIFSILLLSILADASVLPNDDVLAHGSTIDIASLSTHDRMNGSIRSLQATSCLVASNKIPLSFTAESCTPDALGAAIEAAMRKNPLCDGKGTDAEVASLLLGTSENNVDVIHAAAQAQCNAAFEVATLPFGKITKRGDAFDREFFAGGSDWNDQYEITDVDNGKVYHTLSEDASRIKFEIDANTAATRPIEFPSYLPSFHGCYAGAVMCCHVSDRLSNDDDDVDGSGLMNNTDVCVASMADAPVSTRVKGGLAVYHLNEDVEAAEGSVSCHGFAWDDPVDIGNPSASDRYKGNMLFDVAFKQSLYGKGYVKNVPGAPMCGCIEQMPTVTRADCTKILSVSETYTLSANAEGILNLKLSDADVQYGPCDTTNGEDLASHYKEMNAAKDAEAIDSKLVGEGNCLDAIDSSVAAYGYKRSVLEITETIVTPPDYNPAQVTIKFNTAVSDATTADQTFKVHVAAKPDADISIISSVLKYDNTAVELTLDSPPTEGTTYTAYNVVRLHKRIANMVTLESYNTPTRRSIAPAVSVTNWDHLQIGPTWRIGRTCEICSDSHFSISSLYDDAKKTSQIFQDTGSTHKGPRSDYNGWDLESLSGPTYSVDSILFGEYGVQVRDWRIRQIGDDHLSVSHENGNVARIYKSNGSVHGNVPSFNGYATELGAPTCSYLADSYLQVGDWRFAAYDATHLSVAHRLGYTSAIYRTDGTVYSGPRRDYNGWAMPEEDAIMGTKEGCSPLDPSHPNVFQIGSYWRIAQMYDDNHLSFSAKGAGTSYLGGSQTAMIYRGNDGTTHPGKSNFNAWDEVPTYSDAPPQFGDKTLQIDKWRIRQVDDKHLTVSHVDGAAVARIYRYDGKVFSKSPAGFSGWSNPELGDPTCAFLTDKFLQLGEWRMGEMDDDHLSVGHISGNGAFIYRRDGTTHPGPRTTFNPWQFEIGTILQGSANGCDQVLVDETA
jgi:hypothetical protein